jgi:hypothetical protein
VRILITGSRKFTNRALIEDALLDATYRVQDECVTIVHGACPTGADAIADELAEAYEWEREPHEPDWDSNGRAAGPIRNNHMVNLGADLCLAFFKTGARNKGTEHCARAARSAGIPVIEYWD